MAKVTKSAIYDVRVRCAVCDNLVDEVEWYRDICNGRLIIRVRCHGDVDEMAVSELFDGPEVYEAIHHSEGVAFTKKLLSREAG